MMNKKFTKIDAERLVDFKSQTATLLGKVDLEGGVYKRDSIVAKLVTRNGTETVGTTVSGAKPSQPNLSLILKGLWKNKES